MSSVKNVFIGGIVLNTIIIIFVVAGIHFAYTQVSKVGLKNIVHDVWVGKDSVKTDTTATP